MAVSTELIQRRLADLQLAMTRYSADLKRANRVADAAYVEAAVAVDDVATVAAAFQNRITSLAAVTNSGDETSPRSNP